MSRISIILLFSVAACCSYAQVVLPDSIRQRFVGVAQDSNYIVQLNTLASEYLKVNPNASRLVSSYVIELAPQLRFTRGYARGLTIMGSSYWYEGIYEFAQNYYLLAARQYLMLNDSLGLAQVYNNIGEVNKRLGENEKALEYLQRSLEFTGKKIDRSLTLYNIGELYIMMKKFDKADEYIKQSLALGRKDNNERVIAYNYWSIARIHTEQRDYKKAFEYFTLTEEIWKRLGETRSLIQTYQDMGYASRQQGHLDEAMAYLQKATALSRQVEVPDLRVSNYLEHARIDSARGDFKRAFYFLSRHNALKDSVYSLLKTEQIQRVQTIYEMEMHERENRELRIEKELKDSQLRSQNFLIVAITAGLIVAGILAWILFRQRRRILHANADLKEKNVEIHTQKNSIEMQAASLQKLNADLQDLNRLLETRIDERSRMLMLQNQKLAEYTFVNAHKLRAPVASILGLIALINQVEPHEREAILMHLKTCGDQLDTIIREISANLESSIIPAKKD